MRHDGTSLHTVLKFRVSRVEARFFFPSKIVDYINELNGKGF